MNIMNRPTSTVISTPSSKDYNSLLNSIYLNYYNYYFLLYRFIPAFISIGNIAPLITFINYFILYHLFDLYYNI